MPLANLIFELLGVGFVFFDCLHCSSHWFVALAESNRDFVAGEMNKPPTDNRVCHRCRDFAHTSLRVLPKERFGEFDEETDRPIAH